MSCLNRYKQTLFETLQQYKNEGYTPTCLTRDSLITKNNLLILAITNNLASCIVEKIVQDETKATLKINSRDEHIIITLTKETPQ
jgi:hypothetical protein